MSDTNKEKGVLPEQKSPADTSNWDDRPTTDPDGKTYIRTADEDEE